MYDTFTVVLMFLVNLALCGVSFFLGIRMCLEALFRMEDDKFARVVNNLRDKEGAVESITESDDAVPKKTTRINLTAAGDIILAHDAVTGEFLAQGYNTKELLTAAFSRYPNRLFTIAVDTTENETST